MNKYEPVIGLEVHAQIHTASKMFCTCPVVDDTGDIPPNTYVCPVCTGMPGVLPVINQAAIEKAIMTGLALHCEIPRVNRFARKSYFYPDLPKGYQISQYALPLAINGYLEIETRQGQKRIGINRAHQEEDAGKLYHVGDVTHVDLNRAGVPLLEIVSEPDMHSVEEVRSYATRLLEILVYLGVNSGSLEKGMIRFEANVSVRPVGTNELNPRHEIKNLNSLRALTRGVAYEIESQIATLEAGGKVVQQTMGWNEERGVTVPQRSKEEAHDYRYFPEPDLPPLEISEEWVEKLRQRIPELPDARRARLMEDYGLSAYDAQVLVQDKAVADYYDAAVATGKSDPKTIANWISGELFRHLNEKAVAISDIPVSPQALVELIGMVDDGKINLKTGKDVLDEMLSGQGGAREIVDKRGLAQISSKDALLELIKQVLDDHPKEVSQYLGGKMQILGWLMGQVMRASRGKANPQLVRELLQAQLDAKEES